MRIVAGLGFLVFAYLTLIPAGLVIATVDPSCADGGCDESLALTVALTILYGACTLALATTAGALGGYAISPGLQAARRIAAALAVSAAAIGVALFALLAISFPIAGAVIALVGVGLYTWLRRRPGPPDPRSNGHGPPGP
jgi:hypothetical protein